jgi:hypothetical protein
MAGTAARGSLPDRRQDYSQLGDARSSARIGTDLAGLLGVRRSGRFMPADRGLPPTATDARAPAEGAGHATADVAADRATAAVDPMVSVAEARARLGGVRQRFRRGQLPPLGHLLVRPRFPVPGCPGQTADGPADGRKPAAGAYAAEAPWVLVQSWRVPGLLLGRCLNDVRHPALAYLQMGRTLSVDAARIVDWAVVDAAGEIVDGGWSRELRRLPALPDLIGAGEPPAAADGPLIPAG